MSHEVFVWYEDTAPSSLDQGPLSHATVAALKDRFHLEGRLLCRRGERLTWMEHYVGELSPEIIEAIRTPPGWLPPRPSRHLEIFEQVSARESP